MQNNLESFWKKKDIVTYFLSVLVFFVHISALDNYPGRGGIITDINNFASVFLKQTITSFAVPLFFVISGALFFRNYEKSMYLDKLKSRVKTLVIPFLIWNTLWMIFDIITSYSFISSYFIGREKFEVTFLNVLNAVFHYKSNPPFWFIFELIFFVLITPFFDWVLKKKSRAYIIAAVLLMLIEVNIGLPSPLFYSKKAIIYYMLGGFIGRYHFDSFSNKKSKSMQVFSLICFVCFIVAKYFLLVYGVKLLDIFDVLFLSACALSFWNTADLFIEKLKKHDFHTRSFAVFAMHVNISAIICKVLYIIMPKSEYFAVPNFIMTVIFTLLAINVFCILLKRISKTLYSLVMGTR